MMKVYIIPLMTCFLITTTSMYAQYVEPERDDTLRVYVKIPFDTISARNALAEGNITIKGEAFTRPPGYMGEQLGFGIKAGKKIKANKITVYLYPVTPYLVEYLKQKKKENPKKLKFVYIDPNALRYRLTAVTNSDGEFTFPKMKPGEYYLEAILPWSQSGYQNVYTGSGYGSYGGRVDYYDRQQYVQSHHDMLSKFIKIVDNEKVVEVKLK
ncbi:carboxypeptidase-like regulatory domain-containing protein [Belliella marina]|uniref:Carboxypeptidase-like regulatory domain-containing protein n=1 Tax=Belliella marina TaxID=1644146 RepID=A0ABW4VIX3_9BACT